MSTPLPSLTPVIQGLSGLHVQTPLVSPRSETAGPTLMAARLSVTPSSGSPMRSFFQSPSAFPQSERSCSSISPLPSRLSITPHSLLSNVGSPMSERKIVIRHAVQTFRKSLEEAPRVQTPLEELDKDIFEQRPGSYRRKRLNEMETPHYPSEESEREVPDGDLSSMSGSVKRVKQEPGFLELGVAKEDKRITLVARSLLGGRNEPVECKEEFESAQFLIPLNLPLPSTSPDSDSNA